MMARNHYNRPFSCAKGGNPAFRRGAKRARGPLSGLRDWARLAGIKKRLLFTALAVASVAALAFISPAMAESNINKKDSASANGAVAQFTKTIDDLPLMPELETVDEKDVLFVAQEGRIAEATARGPVGAEEVYAFYQRSLPQLGWRKVDDRTFEREGEHLRIDVSGVSASQTSTVVRFSVHPAGGKN